MSAMSARILSGYPIVGPYIIPDSFYYCQIQLVSLSSLVNSLTIKFKKFQYIQSVFISY